MTKKLVPEPLSTRDKYYTGAYHQLYQEEDKKKQATQNHSPQSNNPFKTIHEIISTYSVYLCSNYLQYK